MPSPLDPASVQAKLRRLSDLVTDLDEIGAVDQARLQRERLTLHALERIVTQVVETASSVAAHVAAFLTSAPSTTYRGTFTDLAGLGVVDERLATSLGEAAGMRLLVHHYAGVDLAIVAAAAPMLRRDAEDFISQVGTWLIAQDRRGPRTRENL